MFRVGVVAAIVVVPFTMSACASGGIPAGNAVSAGSGTSSPRDVVRIASLKGPTTMGLVKLMSDAQAGTQSGTQSGTQGGTQSDRQAGTQGRYRVTVHGSPDEIVAPLVKGDIDIALIPANLAAVLYAKSAHAVQLAAVNTLGVLSIVETGDTIHSIADLRGRTVYSTGKGTTPEYVLNHLLRRHGLDPVNDVNVQYKSEATEIAARLATATDAVAVLPQPFTTSAIAANPSLRIALDLTTEWNAVGDGSALVTGVTVVRRAFAESDPAALKGFLADERASAAYTNEQPVKAAALIASYGIVPSAKVAEAAIPGSHITYVDGPAARTMVADYLAVLYAANPVSVGGALPGDDFYYGS